MRLQVAKLLGNTFNYLVTTRREMELLTDVSQDQRCEPVEHT